MKRSVLIDESEIEYYLIDPTGNMTVLVVSFVPVENHPYVAKRIMEIEPSCEQVGYIEMVDITKNSDANISYECSKYEKQVDIRLRMSAGEFCGNATMSAAALYCKNAEILSDETCKVFVASSGTKHPVLVDITKDASEEDLYFGTVNMPRPERIYTRTFCYEGFDLELQVVDFGGISHVIMPFYTKSVQDILDGCSLEDDEFREKAESIVKEWCAQIGCDGLGLMFIRESSSLLVNDKESYVNRIKMNPLVYIPGCDSCFWENSCGSGTTAVGAYYFAKENRNVNTGDEKSVKLTVAQPGGNLTIEVNNYNEYLLGGRVNIL